jgi:iron complex outermembrane receptor protein
VRATNENTGQALPRIAPVRVGATLQWKEGPWGARLGMDHYAAQNRVPNGDRSTAAYTFWNANATYRMTAGVASLLWFVRLENIGNQLAYSASSVLTQTAPNRVPLPGRGVRVGLQASF